MKNKSQRKWKLLPDCIKHGIHASQNQKIAELAFQLGLMLRWADCEIEAWPARKMQSDDESPFRCTTIRTARGAKSGDDDEAWIEIDWEISLPN